MLTADDIWPLVAKLNRAERVRLARRALVGEAVPDGERYVVAPVCGEEFADIGEDPLSWESAGWEDVP